MPTIAAVNGYALGGGCELACACDWIYASSKARFGQPEVKLGIIPGFGGTSRLLRRVGVAWAKELVLTGEPIDAETALRIGLANRVFPPEELLDAARARRGDDRGQGPARRGAGQADPAGGPGRGSAHRPCARAGRLRPRRREPRPLRGNGRLPREARSEVRGTLRSTGGSGGTTPAVVDRGSLRRGVRDRRRVRGRLPLRPRPERPADHRRHAARRPSLPAGKHPEDLAVDRCLGFGRRRVRSGVRPAWPDLVVAHLAPHRQVPDRAWRAYQRGSAPPRAPDARRMAGGRGLRHRGVPHQHGRSAESRLRREGVLPGPVALPVRMGSGRGASGDRVPGAAPRRAFLRVDPPDGAARAVSPAAALRRVGRRATRGPTPAAPTSSIGSRWIRRFRSMRGTRPRSWPSTTARSPRPTPRSHCFWARSRSSGSTARRW